MKGLFIPVRKIGFLELSQRLGKVSRRGPLHASSNVTFRKLLELMKTRRINKISSDANFMKYTFRKNILKLISERLALVFPEIGKEKIEKDLRKLLLKHGVNPDGSDLNRGMMLLVTMQEIRNLIHFIEPSAMVRVRELLSQKGKIMREIGKYIQITGDVKREIDEFFEELKEVVGSTKSEKRVDYHTPLTYTHSSSRKKGGKQALILERSSETAHIREGGTKATLNATGKVESTTKSISGVDGMHIYKGNARISAGSDASSVRREKGLPTEKGVDAGKLTVTSETAKKVQSHNRFLGIVEDIKIVNRDASKTDTGSIKKGIDAVRKIISKNGGKDVSVKIRIGSDGRHSHKMVDEAPTNAAVKYEHSSKEKFEGERRGFRFKGVALKEDGNAVNVVANNLSSSHQVNLASKTQNVESNVNQRSLTGWVTQQIVEKMDVALANGQKEILMELQPPHLGRLRIQVVIHGNNISASFWTPSNDVKAIIESGLGYLQQHFQEQGMNPQTFSVFVGGGQTSEKQQEDTAYTGFRDGRASVHRESEDVNDVQVVSTVNGHYIVNLLG